MHWGKFKTFYQEPGFRVVNPSFEAGRKPCVKCTVSADEQIIYLLAKANWFGGNPVEIENAPVDKVINAYHFEIYSREYESTYIELNKAEKWI